MYIDVSNSQCDWLLNQIPISLYYIIPNWLNLSGIPTKYIERQSSVNNFKKAIFYDEYELSRHF